MSTNIKRRPRRKRRLPDWLDGAIIVLAILLVAAAYLTFPIIFPGLTRGGGEEEEKRPVVLEEGEARPQVPREEEKISPPKIASTAQERKTVEEEVQPQEGAEEVAEVPKTEEKVEEEATKPEEEEVKVATVAEKVPSQPKEEVVSSPEKVEYYEIRTGSFLNKDNADRQAASLKAKGYQVQVYKSGEYYVPIVTLKSEEEVEALGRELSSGVVVAAPKKEISSSPTYGIQVGAFSVESNASNFERELKSKGYDTYIEVKSAPKKIYRVGVKASSKTEALKFAEKLKEQGYDVLVPR